ncbi:mechanosensitive ion channel family protein [Aestuariirhabdus litorea]|uniref:Small-conductance mechanosensitive channel n=1 Tax=Aestuariirhabdus litorea TaxID=2528527 RepID=A0A3P3VU31_9GAMM|nr:mechanosensitive ion channel domain-containing protein [Aestuariirhabdus litorea]RRJ85488.1 mechanosensitive ion channel family protein [Aestuariirhabdus litorea]RWW98707.1 mechanosensitive ion channel [Endozoicomonadaceae bacterium GTF-13]
MDGYLIPWGINIGMALLVFVGGRLLARLVISLISKGLSKTQMDDTLIHFVLSILSVLLTLLVVVAALDQLGVDTTSLVALVGAAGLAVGLALKDSLQNFASGVMLVIFRPFVAGDFIEAGGVSGVVERVTIFSTFMKTPDNRQVIVPNGSIFAGTITNYSAKPTRRVDMVFGISYEDDLLKAKEIMVRVLESDERVLKEPAAVVAVTELADSSVNFNVRPWVNTADYWAVRSDLIERIKLEFDREGITIPFPQRDVHLKQVVGGTA